MRASETSGLVSGWQGRLLRAVPSSSPIDEVERILVTSNERDNVLAGVVPNHG